MSTENTSGKELPITVILRYARQEAALRNLIDAKQSKGVISDAHAREIKGLADELYRQQGMQTDPNNPHTLRSLSDAQAMDAIVRQGCHLLKSKLLELYPELADEVRILLASDRNR
jgi:hypothetical protein